MVDESDRSTSTLKRVGWVLVATGVALMALCVTLGIVKSGPDLARGFTGDEYATPVDRTIKLGEGKYVVFERTWPPSSGARGITITPDQVRVTGPDGDSVDTGGVTGTQTLERDGKEFTGAVSFNTPQAGTYLIRVESAAPTTVLVSRDLASLALEILVWILGGIVGFLVLAAGVAILILAAMRGRRSAAVPVAAAAGWYPDPTYPGRQRYWNGRNWVP